MKKKFITVAIVTVLSILLIGLCACANTFGSIKSALNDAGFEEVEISQEYKDMVKQAYGDEGERAAIHIFKKDTLKVVIVVEFKSNDDLVEALRDRLTDEEIKDAYQELQKLDIVNGNCVFLPVTDLDGSGAKAFKSTKG